MNKHKPLFIQINFFQCTQDITHGIRHVKFFDCCTLTCPSSFPVFYNIYESVYERIIIRDEMLQTPCSSL